MSDFNKGDFTQQGVDGHVRATLRLNEKRYVELDLTTNENARGCTISGNVHDRLNNLDYPIGAAKTIESKTITENGTYNASSDDCDGYNPVTVNVPQPSGNIAITENTAEGEPLDVSQYATATVNVSGGGGDFTTANVTITSNDNALAFDGYVVLDIEDEDHAIVFYNTAHTGSETVVVPLYKGMAIWGIQTVTPSAVSASGNITRDGTDIIITGDGTITVTI